MASGESSSADLNLRHQEWLRTFAGMASELFCVFRIEQGSSVVPEWASDGFERVTGYTVDEFRALSSWLDLVVETDRAIARERFRGLLAGKDTENETRIRRKQGDVRRLQVLARPMWDAPRARVVEICVTARDVTDQRQAEAALQDANQFNEQILSGAHEGILVIDREYRYRFWNPQMERITGLRKAQVLGQTPWEMFPFLKESVLGALLERVFAGEKVTSPDFPYEVPTTKQQGWAVQKMGPLRDRLGRITAALVFVEDVTERRRGDLEREKLLAQLAQSQKLEAIGRLAGGVAHDFNNMLTVILGHSDAALEDLRAGDPLRDILTEIREAGARAASLTRQLLAFSRKQVLRPVPIDLNAIVRGVEKMLGRVLGADVQLVTSLAPDLGVTLADPSQLESVILNLVVNARDAMPSGGRITVETANVDLDEEHVERRSLSGAGPYVLLTITDTGSGMDEETLARCFEPFFTTKEMGKGTGLGLSTAYGIVRQSGGDIGITSELGRGTTVEVYLPRVRGADAERPATAPAVAPARGETLLVVEDEQAILSVVKATLERAGYTVLAARDGVEALRLSGEHRGAIDLVLTDVVMPQMSGRALVDRLKQSRPSLRVIFMSGYTGDAVTNDGLLAHGATFLGKPFTSAELIRNVREALDTPPQA